MQKRLRVVITGKVQGVYFRGATLEEAQRLGLTGWVRNLPDGGVEAVFEGQQDALERILAWCRSGPQGARVDTIHADWAAPTGEHGGFRVRI